MIEETFVLTIIIIGLGIIIYDNKKVILKVVEPMTIEEEIYRIIDGHLSDNHLNGTSDTLTYSVDYNTPMFVIDMLTEISPLLGDMDIDFMVKVEKRAQGKIDYVQFLTDELIYEFNENKL